MDDAPRQETISDDFKVACLRVSGKDCGSTLEDLLESLTILRSYIQRHDNFDYIFTFRHQNILDHLVNIMTCVSDRFVCTALRDLLLTIHDVYLKQNNINGLNEIFQSLKKLLSAQVKNSSALLTIIEFITASIPRGYSALRESSEWLTIYWTGCLPLFSTCWNYVIDQKLQTELLIAAALRCLCKIAKLSKDEDSGELLKFIQSHLEGHLVQEILLSQNSMLWLSLLKIYRTLLEYRLINSNQIRNETEWKISELVVCDWMDLLLKNVPCPLSCSFMWQICSNPPIYNAEHHDVTILRTAVLIVLLALTRVISHESKAGIVPYDLFVKLKGVNCVVCERMSADRPSSQVSAWFFELFLDQDDMMCEGLIALVDIFLIWNDRWNVSSSDLNFIEPIDLFNNLLKNISHDHSVLLDWIISPETVFLAYISRLLQYLISSWPKIWLQHSLDLELQGDSDSQTISGSLVNITSGLESLMSYDDQSSVSDVGTSISSDVAHSGSQASLTSTMTALENLRQSLMLLNDKKLCPFNVDYLLNLLSQVNKSTSGYAYSKNILSMKERIALPELALEIIK